MRSRNRNELPIQFGGSLTLTLGASETNRFEKRVKVCSALRAEKNSLLQPKRETIGKFIDASVNDHAEAERLLKMHPELRQARWIGDEHLLAFLVIENFAEGVSLTRCFGYIVG